DDGVGPASSILVPFEVLPLKATRPRHGCGLRAEGYLLRRTTAGESSGEARTRPSSNESRGRIADPRRAKYDHAGAPLGARSTPAGRDSRTRCVASCTLIEQVMLGSCTQLSDGSTMSIIRSAYIGLLATFATDHNRDARRRSAFRQVGQASAEKI